MPEGPEVKRCAELIRSKIADKTIIAINPLGMKGKFQTIKGLDLDLPVHVEDVDSTGKMIYIKVYRHHRQDSPMRKSALISTLGMNGWWYPPVDQLEPSERDRLVYYSGKPVPASQIIEKALKHSRVELVCDDGTKLYYVDQRNFGNFTHETEKDVYDRIAALGCCLLDEPWSFELSAKMVMKFRETKLRDREIGEVLLDQSVIAGLGNIYRAETLFLSKISPHRKVYDLSDGEIKWMIMCAKTVLFLAYHGHGVMYYGEDLLKNTFGPQVFSRIRNQVTEHGALVRHLVYGQKKDIFGNPVEAETFHGRTMWWSPEVQK